LWIANIELINFKSYRHAVFNFPEPRGEKNLILIGGINGYGKTSLLEALYLCLYGADAMRNLTRAGLNIGKVRGYPSFLERAFNAEALRDKARDMTVRVVIQKTASTGIEIKRRWYFRKNGDGCSWTEEEAVVTELTRNGGGLPKRDGHNLFSLNQLLEDHFIPERVAPLFFFDGEEIKSLADQSRIEQVKMGLEGLLGVVLLRQMVDRLKSFENNKRSGIASVDEQNIDRMGTALAADEAALEKLKIHKDQKQQHRQGLKAEQESLIARMVATGGGGGDIATVKDLVEERTQIQGEQRNAQKSLEKILADKLPFHLMPKSLLQKFRTQLQSEENLIAWQNEYLALQPKQARFEQAFFDAAAPEISPQLTQTQCAAIRGRIAAAWEALFHPMPSNCAAQITHAYLHDSLRERTQVFLDSIDVGRQEVLDLLAQQNEWMARIEDLNRKISRVEGIDRDGTLAEMKENLARVGKDMDAVEIEISAMEHEIVGLEGTVNNTRARYEQEVKRRDETSPVRQFLEQSGRVRAVIEELIPALFPLKVKALAEAMTRVYKRLAHKTQVARIAIDEDGTTHVLSKTDREIPFDRSAGENQIFATALIAGLAEVSKVSAPLVVDTPLGRLDSKHRENILNFWMSDKSRQVILLSQDKEIDADFYRRIKPNVSATFLLKHEDVGYGVGRTTVVPNQYFGDAT